jgi:hypothetical protein
LLLVADTLFIVLHVIYYPSFPDPNLSIEFDGGYAERFQYLKQALIVFMLGLLALRKRAFLYLGWAALFLYLLLDDSLSIHENGGELVAQALGFSPMIGLRPQDFGELAATAFFGLLYAGILVVAYYFSHDHTAKKLSKYLLIMLVILALAGVVVDMVHILASGNLSLGFLLGIVEDGGEMIVMSGIVSLILLSGLRE